MQQNNDLHPLDLYLPDLRRLACIKNFLNTQVEFLKIFGSMKLNAQFSRNYQVIVTKEKKVHNALF